MKVEGVFSVDLTWDTDEEYSTASWQLTESQLGQVEDYLAENFGPPAMARSRKMTPEKEV
nr:hypothetical protein [Rhodococcus sp. (in: high G+C Gram-positive bacteria)]